MGLIRGYWVALDPLALAAMAYMSIGGLYMCIYTWVHMYIHIYKYISVDAYMVYIYIHMYLYIHTYVMGCLGSPCSGVCALGDISWKGAATALSAPTK